MTTVTRYTTREERRLADARLALLGTHPLFGYLALRLPLVADSQRKTIASDGQRIYFNREWVMDSEADDLKTAISRLVMACGLKHHTRRGDRKYAKWQRASQEATLPILAMHRLAASHLAQSPWAGMTAEQIYDQLPDEEDDGDGDGQGEGGAGAAAMGAGAGGSGQPSSDPNNAGETMDLPADAQDDAAAIQASEQEWDEALQNARAMAGREPGHQTGAFEELIDAMHDPVVDWRAMLRQYMTTVAKADYTFARPNRRFASQGLYLPSLRSEAAGLIVFAIDTSASMDYNSLADLWAEIQAAVADVEPEEVVVIQCDTKIKKVDRYDSYSVPEQLGAHGRGGTAFKPVFDYLEREGINPCVMLYHTDLKCYEFGNEPEFPVLWCKYGTYGHEPPFGEVLEIR